MIFETDSLIDCLLYGPMVWRLNDRGEPPSPPVGVTVDVFITTYNEPIEMVLDTGAASSRITYPHRTWILDDGNRPRMRAAAERLKVGYITRAEDSAGHARHAKAGNLNNALVETDGEFIQILDADQVPHSQILDRAPAAPRPLLGGRLQWHSTPFRGRWAKRKRAIIG